MNTILYIVTAVLLIYSYFRDKKKTRMALKKAWKAFENILPEFLVVIVLVGMLLAVMNPAMISKIIGSDSGLFGVIIASVVGSVTLIPGFVAFPTAAMLLQGGAGYMQIGAFIFSLLVAYIIGLVVRGA